jgi:hypothetical protein
MEFFVLYEGVKLIRLAKLAFAVTSLYGISFTNKKKKLGACCHHAYPWG